MGELSSQLVLLVDALPQIHLQRVQDTDHFDLTKWRLGIRVDKRQTFL